MKTEHTPGPWSVSETSPCVISGTRPDKPYTFALAETFGYKEEREANALLIAAAPDLFAELRHLVRLLAPMEREGSLNVPGLATLNGARAAIEKAEGTLCKSIST